MVLITQSQQHVLDLIRSAGVVRPRDLDAHGISRVQLQRLYQRGLVERVGRGLYVVAGHELTEHHSMAEVAKRVPNGVICLLSALEFHGLTTQNPFEVWLALQRGVRRPKMLDVPLHVVWFSGAAFTEGIEEHVLEGVAVRLYNPAKTVADCFKYRYKIGLDVALEALRATWNGHRASMDELWHYATVCHVAEVIRPYLESLP